MVHHRLCGAGVAVRTHASGAVEVVAEVVVGVDEARARSQRRKQAVSRRGVVQPSPGGRPVAGVGDGQGRGQRRAHSSRGMVQSGQAAVAVAVAQAHRRGGRSAGRGGQRQSAVGRGGRRRRAAAGSQQALQAVARVRVAERALPLCSLGAADVRLVRLLQVVDHRHGACTHTYRQTAQ